MIDDKPARASEIVEAAANEAAIEKHNIELAPPTTHLDVIISLFPSLPEMCQQTVRANVEALVELAV
jgi:hypothetical protein